MSALLLLAALQALGGGVPGEAASAAGHMASVAQVERTLALDGGAAAARRAPPAADGEAPVAPPLRPDPLGHIPPVPHSDVLSPTSRIRPGRLGLPLIARRGLPPQDAPAAPDAWLGPDKARHFFLSFAATALAHGALRAAGLDGGVALAGAAGVAVAAGAWKELRDRRVPGETASVRDGAWDLLGVAAAVALLSGI